MNFLQLLFSCLALFSSPDFNQPSATAEHVRLSKTEFELYKLLIDYRKAEGLESIPLSKSLTFVAQTHAQDLAINQPHLKPGCNAHSWSNSGNWKGCCYTANHAQAACMWNKPKELTHYTGNGYEIAVYLEADKKVSTILTPQQALNSWKGSYYHNAAILNKGPMKSAQWKAIGIGMYKGVATVWFGEEPDAEGLPEIP